MTRTVLLTVSGALFVYSWLVAARVLWPWLGRPSTGRGWRWLCRLTDPYLSLWKHLGRRSKRPVNASGISAVLLLVFVQNILNILADYRVLTLGVVLAFILRAIWYITVWILLFFVLLIAIRLLSLLSRTEQSNDSQDRWRQMDALLRPLSWPLIKALPERIPRAVPILLSLLSLLGLWLLGFWIVGQLIELLFRLRI